MIKLQVKFTHWYERHPQLKIGVESGRPFQEPYCTILAANEPVHFYPHVLCEEVSSLSKENVLWHGIAETYSVNLAKTAPILTSTHFEEHRVYPTALWPWKLIHLSILYPLNIWQKCGYNGYHGI